MKKNKLSVLVMRLGKRTSTTIIATIVLLGIVLILFTGCAAIIASLIASAVEDKPASIEESMSFNSVDKALNAAVRAAQKTGWSIRTVDRSSGFLYAEQEVRPMGAGSRVYLFKLDVTIVDQGDGSMIVNVKVTPPPSVRSKKENKPEARAKNFLYALREESK